MGSARRTTAAWFGLVGVLVVVLGAAAFACANLATLNLSTPVATPGAEVTASSTLEPTPLVLHWDGPHGLVLAQAEPDENGRISAAFTVPEAHAGPHRVVATRVTPDGVDSHVTTALSPIELRAPAASPAGGAPAGGAAPGGSAPGWAAGLVAACALGVGLLAAGAGRAWGHLAAAPAPAPAEPR